MPIDVPQTTADAVRELVVSTLPRIGPQYNAILDRYVAFADRHKDAAHAFGIAERFLREAGVCINASVLIQTQQATFNTSSPGNFRALRLGFSATTPTTYGITLAVGDEGPVPWAEVRPALLIFGVEWLPDLLLAVDAAISKALAPKQGWAVVRD